MSEGAEKLYKMCHLFLQVAKIYVEAKTKEASELVSRANQPGFYNSDSTNNGADATGFDANAMTQFDPYLSALGLVPNSVWPMAGPFPPLPTGMDGFGQGLDGFGGTLSVGGQNPIQDWFSRSRYIIGLMEEDINMPDLNL